MAEEAAVDDAAPAAPQARWALREMMWTIGPFTTLYFQQIARCVRLLGNSSRAIVSIDTSKGSVARAALDAYQRALRTAPFAKGADAAVDEAILWLDYGAYQPAPRELCGTMSLRQIYVDSLTHDAEALRLLLRLHASLEMLRDTSRDLSTIALDLGFADHSHFTMAFRRRFGVTPSGWRGRAIS